MRSALFHTMVFAAETPEYLRCLISGLLLPDNWILLKSCKSGTVLFETSEISDPRVQKSILVTEDYDLCLKVHMQHISVHHPIWKNESVLIQDRDPETVAVRVRNLISVLGTYTVCCGNEDHYISAFNRLSESRKSKLECFVESDFQEKLLDGTS